MRDRINRWPAEPWRLCRLAEDASPRWARMLLVASLGVLLFADRVEIPGVGTMTYLILVGIVFAGTATFVGGRVIREGRNRGSQPPGTPR